MAIKKYRVAHGLESVILGILICAGLAIMYVRMDKPNITQNKEIVHLNKIFQEKMKEEKNNIFPEFEKTVTPYKSEENFTLQLKEVLSTAKTLNDQIKGLITHCNNDDKCKRDVDELITLLGIGGLPPQTL